MKLRDCCLIVALELSLTCVTGVQAQELSEFPNFGRYDIYAGKQLTERGIRVSQVLSGVVPLPMANHIVAVLGRAGTCVQDTGLLSWNLYISQQDRLATGVVALVSKTKGRDWTVWLDCGRHAVVGGGPSGSEALSPCSGRGASYRTASDEYVYFYAASKQSVCADFARGFEGNSRSQSYDETKRPDSAPLPAGAQPPRR